MTHNNCQKISTGKLLRSFQTVMRTEVWETRKSITPQSGNGFRLLLLLRSRAIFSRKLGAESIDKGTGEARCYDVLRWVRPPGRPITAREIHPCFLGRELVDRLKDNI